MSLMFGSKFVSISSTQTPFEYLYKTYPRPITHTEPQSAALINSYRSTQSLQELIQLTFGQCNRHLYKLIMSKLVYTIDSNEYVYDLPGMGRISSTSNNTGDYTIYMDGQPHKAILNWGERRKIDKIDHSLFMKGLMAAPFLVVDNLYKIVESHIPYYTALSFEEILSIHKFLSNFSQEKIVRIFAKGFDSEYLLTDTVRQFNEYQELGAKIPKKWSTLRELHDDISKQIRDIKAQLRSKPIQYSEFFQKMNGVKLDRELEIVFPKTTAELVEWGNTLNNCVASYDNKVLEKTSLILGALKNGELTYCIELDTRQIIKEEIRPFNSIAQFRGPRNSQPDPEDRQIIENFLYGRTQAPDITK